MQIPMKVQKEMEANLSLDWIEKYDRLYNDELLKDKLKVENQLSYWRINCSIRVALKEIEQVIQSSHKPSTRLVGWSEIARRSSCDRNTLKRSERIKWIEETREKLLMLIEEKKRKKTFNELLVISTPEQEIVELNKKLELSKKEAAKWFVKYEELSTELNFTKEALNRQMKFNSTLDEGVSTLKKRIKELMARN